MLEGNKLHETLKSKGTLSDINLTVPEAIKFTGNKALGLAEWVGTKLFYLIRFLTMQKAIVL